MADDTNAGPQIQYTEMVDGIRGECLATDYSRPGRLITAVVQSVPVPSNIREVGRALFNSTESVDERSVRVGGDSEGS